MNYKGTEQLGDIYWTAYRPEKLGEKSPNYKVYRDQVINSVLAFGDKARGGVFSFYHGHPTGHDAPNGNDNRAYSWDDVNEAEWLYRQMYPTINGMYYAYGDDRRLGNEGVAGFHVSTANGWLQKYPFKTPNY